MTTKKEKKKSKFIGLASRKQRRETAKRNGIKFEPQYNGEKPLRVQHKDVFKIERNEERRQEKRKKNA